VRQGTFYLAGRPNGNGGSNPAVPRLGPEVISKRPAELAGYVSAHTLNANAEGARPIPVRIFDFSLLEMPFSVILDFRLLCRPSVVRDTQERAPWKHFA